MPLAGRPMVEWSIDAFLACEAVGAIIVACPPGMSYGPSDGDRVEVVAGGATRAESVSNALTNVATELVAIHDAARPLLTPDLIEGVIDTLLADPDAAGAIAAAPVTDTIKLTIDRRLWTSPPYSVVNSTVSVEETLDRELLWAAQTPQVFRTEALRQALGADPDAVSAATDEAMPVEAAGGKVLIHPSPPDNLKVTMPLDLKLAELLLAERAG